MDRVFVLFQWVFVVLHVGGGMGRGFINTKSGLIGVVHMLIEVSLHVP